MTSLQRQLAVIAANSTKQLDLKAQRAAHSKSLLFDPKVAASQDFNTIYQICYEGFGELCSLDGRFLTYSQSLFSEQSKTEEREQWTAEQNKELDAVLEDFLGLVGGRLLLKPAQKAVEWLIRRFRVHEYNTDCLILTFLPYHSTSLFVALLSILPPQLSPTFRFLYPYMTSLSNPPIAAVIHSATTNLPFFSGLSRYVVKVSQALHGYAELLSFWTRVAAQAVDGMIIAAQSGRDAIQNEKVEQILLLILPILGDAFALKDIPPLTEACCTIVTVLVARANLNDVVLDSLMETVANTWPEPTVNVRLVCLAVIAQHRNAKRLPKSVTKRLLSVSNSTDRLLPISKKYQVDRLALGYALGSVARMSKHENSGEVEVIEKILQAAILSKKQIKVVLSAILKQTAAVEDLTPSKRQSFAQLLIFIAGSKTLQDEWASSVEKHSIDLTKLEERLEVNFPRSEDSIEEVQIEHDQSDARRVAPHTTSYHGGIAKLSRLKPTSRSFMSLENTEDFMKLAEVFTTAVESSKTALPSDHELMHLPVLRQKSALQDPTFLSFFLRIGSSSYPARVRRTALMIIGDTLVDALKTQEVQLILLPHLLIGLADENRNLRLHSAEILKQIAHVNSGKAVEQTRAIQWSTRDLYPEQPSMFSPSADYQVDQFNKLLTSHLDACVLDAAVLPRILQAVLEDVSLRKSPLVLLLVSHAAASLDLAMQSRLFSILARLNRKHLEWPRDIIHSCTTKFFQLNLETAISRCTADKISLQDVDDALVALITPDEIQTLRDIVQGKLASDRADVQETGFKRLEKIWPIMPSEAQNSMAVVLLEIALTSKTDTSLLFRKDLALEALSSIKLSTETLIALLNALPNAVQMPDNPPATKRRRTSREQMWRVDIVNTEDLSQAIRRYTVTLELVARSEPQKHPSLLKPLFHSFGEIQHYKTQTDSGLVYLQGLVIDSLLAIVNSAKDSQKPPADVAAVRTDLLVDCLRHSTNPQVQRSALLLISCLASWVPDVVLHSVMPIFTFMGSTILRQSDDYSAHVIDQTVSRVLPPLAASLRRSSRRVLAGVADLLQSFVAAFEHMPLHRRLVLFEKVIRALGPADCLFAALIMLVDRYSAGHQVVRFLAELLGQFDAETQLLAIEQYVELLVDMRKSRRDVSELVLGLKDKSNDQLRQMNSNLLSSLAALLENNQIQSRVAKSFTEQNEHIEEQRKHFEWLVQGSVKITSSLKGEASLSTLAERVLSNVFHLLPLEELLQSARPLLEQRASEVGSVLLQSITAQCRHVKATDQSGKVSLLDFVAAVASVIEKSTDASLKRASIACIDQISERFGKQDTPKILSVAQTISGPRALGDLDTNVQIMSLLCLASIVEVLRDDFIGFVPKVFPQTFDYLHSSIEPESQNVTLHNACFALINSVIEYLPFVFTGNLLDRSLQLAQESANSSIANEVQDSRAQFYELLTKKQSASEIFPALQRNLAIDRVHSEYLDFANDLVKHHSRSTIIRNSATLFGFLLHSFDYRRNHIADDETIVDKTESAIIDIAVVVTMKLSDTTFRPLFIRLVDWVDELKNDLPEKRLRATVLFRFFSTLSVELKCLLTNYSAYILDLAAELLQTTAMTDINAEPLLTFLLMALCESFGNDEDSFWQSPAHFDTIMPPLLSLLSRSASMLPPKFLLTVGSLASASSSPDHHKTLNGQLLKLMRSDDKATRLAAVKCEGVITEKLGEEWLVLVHEMLPILQELFEDDDAEVEREARKWAKRVEEITGERLDAMLG